MKLVKNRPNRKNRIFRFRLLSNDRAYWAAAVAPIGIDTITYPITIGLGVYYYTIYNIFLWFWWIIILLIRTDSECDKVILNTSLLISAQIVKHVFFGFWHILYKIWESTKLSWRLSHQIHYDTFVRLNWQSFTVSDLWSITGAIDIRKTKWMISEEKKTNGEWNASAMFYNRQQSQPTIATEHSFLCFAYQNLILFSLTVSIRCYSTHSILFPVLLYAVISLRRSV